MKATKSDKTAPSDSVRRIVLLFDLWKRNADYCEDEIKKAKDPNESLIMSDREIAKYEQAAITFRACAHQLPKENGNNPPTPKTQ